MEAIAAFHLPSRGTGLFPGARSIANVGNFEGLCRARDIDRSGGFDGVSNANIRHWNFRTFRFLFLIGCRGLNGLLRLRVISSG
jgi:hypothetical protein